MKYYFKGKRWNVDYVKHWDGTLEVWLEQGGDEIAADRLPRKDREQLWEDLQVDLAVEKHFGGDDELF